MRVMRVITRANIGGPARQIAALEPEFAVRGIESLVVTGVVGEGERELDLGLPRITPERALDEGFRAVGWCTLPDFGRPLRPGSDWDVMRQLRALVDAFRPHVVHTHTSKAGLLGRFAARNAVVAHTYHGLVLRDYYGALVSSVTRRLEAMVARRTDLLFAVSESCRRELHELGVAHAERIDVLPPAVAQGPVDPAVRDTVRDDLRRQAGVAADARCVVGVGRLAAIKRPEMFVELARRRPEVAFGWIGDGVGRQLLADAAPPNMVWLGWRDDPSPWLAAADALVLPSRREGYPVVGIEATRLGTPTIGFEVPGVSDLLADTGRGPGVQARDGVGGLASELDALLAAGAPRLDAAVIERFHVDTSPATVAQHLAVAYRAARIRGERGGRRR